MEKSKNLEQLNYDQNIHINNQFKSQLILTVLCLGLFRWNPAT
jgi:hypothetical protein